MKMPDKFKDLLVNRLYKDTMSVPIVGSESLDCYNLLYAIYFSRGDQEGCYMKAATIAYTVYAALETTLTQSFPGQTRPAEAAAVEPPRRGDCLAKPHDVP